MNQREVALLEWALGKPGLDEVVHGLLKALEEEKRLEALERGPPRGEILDWTALKPPGADCVNPLLFSDITTPVPRIVVMANAAARNRFDLRLGRHNADRLIPPELVYDTYKRFQSFQPGTTTLRSKDGSSGSFRFIPRMTSRADIACCEFISID